MARKISAAVNIESGGMIDDLKKWCSERNIKFSFRGLRPSGKGFIPAMCIQDGGNVGDLYYFYIDCDTKTFDEFNEFSGKKIFLCDNCEIANVNDGPDNKFEKNLEHLLYAQKQANEYLAKAEDLFSEFINSIEKLDVLYFFDKKYGRMFTKHQRALIDKRIADISFENYININDAKKTDVLFLREKTGMNRKEFSEYFGIPYRTVEDWEKGASSCSSYLYDLMEYKLIKDGVIVV